MIQTSQVLVVALSLAGSIISAFVAVWLSLRKFRSERWWEKKAETYSKLIEDLAVFQIDCEWWERQYEVYVEGFTAEIGGNESLGKQAREARDSVKKSTAIGAYIVSDETAAVLKGLREALDEAEKIAFDGGPDEWLKANKVECEAVKKSIAELRRCAKRDMGLR